MGDRVNHYPALVRMVLASLAKGEDQGERQPRGKMFVAVLQRFRSVESIETNCSEEFLPSFHDRQTNGCVQMGK